MKLRNIILTTVLLATFSACEDMFEPAKENNRGVEEMLSDPNYAVGLLGYGYAMLPYDNSSVSDVATDDAVTNDKEVAIQKWLLVHGRRIIILWNSGKPVKRQYNTSIHF